MGVKFLRDYDDIILELRDSILTIPKFYTFLGMEDNDFSSLSKSSKEEFARTLSDDLFYGLDAKSTIELGEGLIKLNDTNKTIEIFVNDILTNTIKL